MRVTAPLEDSPYEDHCCCLAPIAGDVAEGGRQLRAGPDREDAGVIEPEVPADPMRRVLHDVWIAAVDAACSADLRDGDGVLNEQVYLTYQRNTFDAAVAKLRPTAVFVVTEESGYDVGRVVRGVYATSEAAMRAHPGEWKPAGTSIDGEPDSWSAGLRDIDRYEVQT